MTTSERTPKFYKPVDWAAFWTATLVAFVVYFLTLCPSVGLEDSGELAVAADWLGVPHPPGYPIWSMLCWLFARTFSFVKYMGQPNPAWSISLASAVFGAFAAGLTAMLICRSGSDILRHAGQITHDLSERTERMICFVGGVTASLLFAFTPIMWSQAVIVEVYSLNALFLTWVLLLVYQWMKRPSDRTLLLASFLFGLGLTNYQVLLLAALALAICIMFKKFSLFRDFVVAAAPFLIVIALIKTPLVEKVIPGQGPKLVPLLPPIVHPSDITCFVYMGLNAAWLTLVYFLLPHGRVVAGSILLAELGLSVYGYMPIVSDLRNPPMNWGYPRTWEGFKHAVTRGQYEKIVVADVFSSHFLKQCGVYLADLRINYSLLGALLGFLPFATWRLKNSERSYNALPVAAILGGVAVLIALLAGDSEHVLASLYKVPAMGMLVVLCVGGGVVLVDTFRPVYNTWMTDRDALLWQRLTALTIYLVTGAGWIMLVLYHVDVATAPLMPAGKPIPQEVSGFVSHAKLIAYVAALVYAAHLAFDAFLDRALSLEGVRKRQRQWIMVAAMLVFSLFWFLLLLVKSRGLEGVPHINETHVKAVIKGTVGLPVYLLLPVPLILLYSKLIDQKEHFEITIDREARQWFAATAVAFLMLSIALIALANLKMDIQDTFIQRVKFISSHALFALWVGYGLIFLLATIDGLARDSKLVRYASLGVALAIVSIPLLKNKYDSYLVDVYGGSEQNGHNFGWQFGNYELRGAEAILEELSPDEEPLPNPTYPPAMTQNAIFYGGTDPGRFVPTYMIYSARVREDVYLITQNALADNTYMAVMRDLYGNDIWIPSEEDSGQAFKRYVDDIEAGRRPKNAGIKTEGGRVQVSGVLGVMEINGILAEEIFNRNKWRHDFYLEESYVIQWMYPYLTPHGLIMKINDNRLSGIPPATVRDDMDFWDWYTRRLTSQERFRRDVVARKSFSKLRSAIAGLYAYRGMRENAERAFDESRRLYPLSPEANFRLAEVYMRNRQFQKARDLITAFWKEDPLNSRVQSFIDQINRLDKIYGDIDSIRTAHPGGKMDANTALKLAGLYQASGQIGMFNNLAGSLLRNTQLPPVVHFQLAKLYIRAGNRGTAGKALDRCLAELPKNTEARTLLDIAGAYSQIQNMPGMQAAMERYLTLAPTDWKGWLDNAMLCLRLHQPEKAAQALGMALRHGGGAAEAEISRNPQLRELRSRLRSPAPVSTGNLDRFMNPGGTHNTGNSLLPGAGRP